MKTIGTCETCIHWHQHIRIMFKHGRSKYDTDICDAIKFDMEHYEEIKRLYTIIDEIPLDSGFCMHPKLMHPRFAPKGQESEGDTINWAYSEDWPDDPGGLRTGKDFGCIHWEERK